MLCVTQFKIFWDYISFESVEFQLVSVNVHHFLLLEAVKYFIDNLF